MVDDHVAGGRDAPRVRAEGAFGVNPVDDQQAAQRRRQRGRESEKRSAHRCASLPRPPGSRRGSIRGMIDPERWIGTTLLAIIAVVFAAGVALSLVLTTIRIHFTRQRPIGLCRMCGYSLTGN